MKLLDGTHNVDLERRISELESKAVPLLRAIEDTWRLPIQERAVVTEFIALQMVRGPVWRRFAVERARAVLEEQRAAKPDFPAEKWPQVEEALLGQEGPSLPSSIETLMIT